MERSILQHTFLPELGTPYRGKVRDIYEQNDTLTMVASDRISIFDRILNEPIKDKGRVLTSLSQFWFNNTEDIIPNHVLSQPDPNVIVVKKCRPLLVEMIVRGHLVGSLWRDYKAGKREKCGVLLPDGLKQNDPLPNPIVTPTTKSHEGHDEDISKEELVKTGIVTRKQWETLEKTSLELFRRGKEMVKEKGLILVDTKYEFGLDNKGNIVLIDEIHTPDSSRFWFQKDLEIQEVRFPDKELVREWAMGLGFVGQGAIPTVPEEIREQVRAGYRQVYETITGQRLCDEEGSIQQRVLTHLKKAAIIKGKFALLLVGSEKDQPHVNKITEALDDQGIPNRTLIASAHKQPETVLKTIEEYNESLEPLVCITIAGRSNALSGVVAANLKWPVIACPPFKDYGDYLTNIHSSLQMPSNVPVMTVVEPKNGALAAARILKTMELTS
ncbi:MAG: phosphoribosylaminoimidazolesuccinocarboxamide synthase [Waddliaceae bacterium]